MMDNSAHLEQYTQPLALRHHDICPMHWEKFTYTGLHRSSSVLRDYYMMQYVVSGKVICWINQRPHPLEAGQCIVYHPNDLVMEEVEEGESATYYHLAVVGTQAQFYFSMMGITREHPLFPWKGNQVIEENMEIIRSYGSSMDALSVHTQEQMVWRLKRQKALHTILLECLQSPVVLPPVHKKFDYVGKAISYMEEHYSSRITIADIAENVGLSRSHLFVHFKNATNRSPQEYLSMIRVQKACEFLRNPSASIADVANSLGYSEPHSFSRLFRQIMQVTPTEYRRQITPLEDRRPIKTK